MPDWNSWAKVFANLWCCQLLVAAFSCFCLDFSTLALAFVLFTFYLSGCHSRCYMSNVKFTFWSQLLLANYFAFRLLCTLRGNFTAPVAKHLTWLLMIIQLPCIRCLYKLCIYTQRCLDLQWPKEKYCKTPDIWVGCFWVEAADLRATKYILDIRFFC